MDLAGALFVLGLFLFVVSLPGGLVGYYIGRSKEAPISGFLLGLFFGPVGWIIAAFIDHRHCCPFCRGRVPRGAGICLHCNGLLLTRRFSPNRFARHTTKQPVNPYADDERRPNGDETQDWLEHLN